MYFNFFILKLFYCAIGLLDTIKPEMQKLI